MGGPQDNRGGAQLVHKLHRECGARGARLPSRSAKRTTKRWGSCAHFTQDTGASVSMIAAPEEACQHNKHHAQPGGAGQSARQHSEDSGPMPLQILPETPAVSLAMSLDLVGPPTRILADLQAILQDADHLDCATAHIQQTLQSIHGQLRMSIVHGRYVFRHRGPKGRCICTHGCHKSARQGVASITEMERHQTVLVWCVHVYTKH